MKGHPDSAPPSSLRSKDGEMEGHPDSAPPSSLRSKDGEMEGHPDSAPPVIRVLIVHQHAIIGGAEHSIEIWATHMPDRLRPIVLLGEDGPLVERLRSHGVETHIMEFPPFRPARAPRIVAAIARLLRFARGHHVALIHSNTPRTNLYAALAGRVGGIPVIWHARNLIHGPMRDVERALSFLPDRILCISHAVERRFQKDGTLPPHVVTIHHGIDTAAFSPEVSGTRSRTDLGLLPDEVAVGIVGRIGVGKGHPLFIQAATRALQRGSKARFVIVGGAQSPEEIEIERDARLQVSRGAFGDRFTFAGMRSDIPSVMAGLDIVTLCTEAEPLGRVVLEAMSTGKPVIASDAGGVPELIENGASGLLYPTGDAEALAAAILRLEQDASLRTRMGRAARRRVEERFGVERHVARMEQLYWEVLSSP